jgi:hypothetical protein
MAGADRPRNTRIYSCYWCDSWFFDRHQAAPLMIRRDWPDIEASYAAEAVREAEFGGELAC